jgi:gliding motility-associated-like protein
MRAIRLVLLLMFLSPECFAQSGLVASYNFTSGLEDSGLNHHNAVGIGSYSTNGTLNFPNDATSFVTLPSEVFEGLTDFTIYCKFYLNELNGDLNLILSGANADALNYFILYYIPWQGQWGFSYQNINYNFDATDPEPNQWYCLMLTRSSNVFSLYVNGVKAQDLTINGDPLHVGKMILGQEQDCLGGCFEWNQNLNGMLDNFSVFDRSLSVNEILNGCIDPVIIQDPDPDPNPNPDPDPNPGPTVSGLILPNVITPNNDGYNDRLVFWDDLKLEIKYLTIYNRYGQRIFYTSSYNGEWDGADLSSGVYFYTFEYNGKTYKGPVSVVK